jgi:hypothetical protein|tara:strand:- start:507 stop:1031 length:525 start_codon:yes stop_codon:yes gene_type:complete
MSAVAFQLIGTVIGAVAKVRSAQAEQVQYEMKARNEEIKGRIDAVNYKNQGTEVLRNMEKAMAASTARSAAGGLNPFASGESADLINTYSMNIGVGDFGMARTNAMLALDAGKRNASQFRTAGKYAVQYGMMSAAAGAFTGASQAFEAGGNPFAKLFSTTPSTLPNANTRSGAQ